MGSSFVSLPFDLNGRKKLPLNGEGDLPFVFRNLELPHIFGRFQLEWPDRELEGRVDGRAGRKPRRPGVGLVVSDHPAPKEGIALVADTDTPMPAIVSSNTQAPTVMIAEKAVDLVTGRERHSSTQNGAPYERIGPSHICNGRTSHQRHESRKGIRVSQ